MKIINLPIEFIDSFIVPVYNERYSQRQEEKKNERYVIGIYASMVI